MHLALGVMEAAGARPAIGAAEHGAGAARVADARQLVAEEVERLLPADRDEFVAAAAIVGPRPALEPAAADRRLGNARLVAQRAGEIVDDAVRIGIARIGPDLESGLAVTRRKHAPMRGVRLEAVRQVEAGIGEANRIVHRLILVPVVVAVYRSTSRCHEIRADANAGLPCATICRMFRWNECLAAGPQRLQQARGSNEVLGREALGELLP